LKFISITIGVTIGTVLGALLVLAIITNGIERAAEPATTAAPPPHVYASCQQGDNCSAPTTLPDPCATKRAAYEAAFNAWNGDAGSQEDKVRRLHEASLSCDYGVPVTLLPAHPRPDTPADPTPTLGPDRP